MTRIQSKFRCLEVTHRWDTTTSIRLAPVHGDQHPENKMFWEYTPSGSCEITFSKGVVAPFEPGAYYYIFQEIAPCEFPWVLEKVIDHGETLEVELKRSSWKSDLQQGVLKVSICNKDCWPAFQGKVRSEWSLSFEKATEAGDADTYDFV